jgi:hypothetical protein
LVFFKMKKVGLPGMASNLPIEHVSGYGCYTAVIQKGRTTLMKQASFAGASGTYRIVATPNGEFASASFEAPDCS